MAINAFFVVLGSCLSVGLALWLDVSELAERLKANRKRRRLPTVLDPDSLSDRRPDSETGGQSSRTWAPTPVHSRPIHSRIEEDAPVAYVRIGGKPLAPKRELPDWLATILLLAVELRSFLLGILLGASAFLVVIPAGQALNAPEEVTAGVFAAMFIAGLFAISWTWVGVLRRPLWIRVLLSSAVPVVLFGSAVFSAATDNGLAGTFSTALAWFASVAPVLSIYLRSKFA